MKNRKFCRPFSYSICFVQYLPRKAMLHFHSIICIRVTVWKLTFYFFISRVNFHNAIDVFQKTWELFLCTTDSAIPFSLISDRVILLISGTVCWLLVWCARTYLSLQIAVKVKRGCWIFICRIQLFKQQSLRYTSNCKSDISYLYCLSVLQSITVSDSESYFIYPVAVNMVR